MRFAICPRRDQRSRCFIRTQSSHAHLTLRCQRAAESPTIQRRGALKVCAILATGTWFAPLSAQAQELRAPVQIESCSPCHGVDGVARDEEVPNLAGQHEVYIYKQLEAFRSGQRKHKEMRYMSKTLTDEEMKALATYFATLPRS